jgi:hypothetical protein
MIAMMTSGISRTNLTNLMDVGIQIRHSIVFIYIFYSFFTMYGNN